MIHELTRTGRELFTGNRGRGGGKVIARFLSAKRRLWLTSRCSRLPTVADNRTSRDCISVAQVDTDGHCTAILNWRQLQLF